MKTLSSSLLIACLIFALNTYAEISTENIDPGRINLDDLDSKEPTIGLKEKKELKKKSVEEIEVIKKAKSTVFTLKKIVIEDVTVFDKSKLLGKFTDKIGKEISLFDVQIAAQEMTTYYRAKGYIISQVVASSEEVDRGIIKFTAIEGFVDKVYLIGDNIPGGAEFIEKFANKISESNPLNISKLERYALIANDIPGLEVRTLFSPSPSVYGAADLTFIMKHKSENFMISYDNRVNRIYGPQQYTAAGFINLTSIGSQASVIGRKSSSGERLLLSSFSYKNMLSTEGLTIDINYMQVKTKPKFVRAVNNLFDKRGKSDSVGVTFTYPVLKKLYKTLDVYTAFDLNNSTTTANDPSVEFQDRIRSLRVGINYEFSDRLKGVNFIDTSISKGLNVFGATKNDNAAINRSRTGGRSDYFKVNLQVTRVQYFPNNFSILFGITGQYSSHELLSPEEFGFGGTSFGKGYSYNILAGDHGIAGKVEPRYTLFMDNKLIKTLQLFAFYDIGAIWNINPSQHINGSNRQSASTAGYGARIFATKYLYGFVELGKPLTRANNQGNKDWKVFFGLTARL